MSSQQMRNTLGTNVIKSPMSLPSLRYRTTRMKMIIHAQQTRIATFINRKATNKNLTWTYGENVQLSWKKEGEYLCDYQIWKITKPIKKQIFMSFVAWPTDQVSNMLFGITVKKITLHWTDRQSELGKCLCTGQSI